MKKRKLCIITGSRAEWGLFYPLAKEIKRDQQSFVLQIIACGSHLSSRFGLTCREIEEDGFKIDRGIRTLTPGNTKDAIVNSVSSGIKKVASALKSLKPDLVILLGDRFETFAASAACLFLGVPIAHIHGGELTEGSMDDAMRHAITKMSYLHFTSTDTYRKRVIRMGEEPERVFTVGALGLDNIRKRDLLTRKELEREIKFKLGKKNIIITFSPCTAEKKEATIRQFDSLLGAVRRLQGVNLIFTKPNPDLYSGIITGQIDGYVAKNRNKAVSFVSMGRRLYLSALQFMDVVAGNSSSGIIEAPSFGIPTVNIGRRQGGRVKAASVIDVGDGIEPVRRAFKKAFSARFKKKCKNVTNPYKNTNTAKRIVRLIKKTDLSAPKKNFYETTIKRGV